MRRRSSDTDVAFERAAGFNSKEVTGRASLAQGLCAGSRPSYPPQLRRCAPAAITMPNPASSDTADVPP
jgi:hypothetical protein